VECFFGLGSDTPGFIKAVPSIFGDIHLDSTALRAVANLLAENEHIIPARDYYQLSLDLAENEVDKIKTRLKFSDLMIGKANEGDGGDSVEETDYFGGFERPYELLLATTSTDPPTTDQALLKLFQMSLMHQSYCEMKLGLFEKAFASFERARSMLPDELLDEGSLTILPSILAVEQNKYQELIEKLHGWNVLELMAWLSQEYQGQGPLAEDPNTTFGRAGHLSGNDEFVTKAYEEIIRFMDERNMHGARKMRFNLAEFHINVSPDLGKAKRLLYEVCDLQASFPVPKLES
jgi:tetratricopeptide (TPR) repeat protein